MTSWVVADSGLYLAVELKETHASNADALFQAWSANQYQIAVPYLFQYEFVSVIRRNVARGTLPYGDGQTLLHRLLQYPIQTFTDELLLQRAFELATMHNRPTAYDSFYLALAEHLKCEFWTADQKLFNAVGGALTWVKWIGNFALPQPQTQI